MYIKKFNLANIIHDNCSHLKSEEKNKLFRLLTSFKDLFDGTLGDWNTNPVDLELKKDAEPCHSKKFSVPQIHYSTLKTELDRLVEIGVLEKNSDSPWSSPTFIIPKKNGTVRFISDFRKVNKIIVRKPYPLPKIDDIIQQLQGFKFATSLDLNIGYYHINLSLNAQKIRTITTPFGKYRYKKLRMGISVATDIF